MHQCPGIAHLPSMFSSLGRRTVAPSSTKAATPLRCTSAGGRPAPGPATLPHPPPHCGAQLPRTSPVPRWAVCHRDTCIRWPCSAHTGAPGVISRKFSVREIATKSLLVARNNYIWKNNTFCYTWLHTPSEMYLYWTAKPVVPRRVRGHCNHLIHSQL